MSTRNDSSHGTCRDASTRANASLTDARGAEGLEREAGFEYLDTAAEMDARRSRTDLVSEPFFHRKMFNPRCPHTLDEFTLEMKVNVQGLRMEIVHSQPESPLQCDASPRRLPAFDTASEAPIARDRYGVG